MDIEIVLERRAELIGLLSEALTRADQLDLIDVAIRISQAIDLMETTANDQLQGDQTQD
jgi:hypothetical protein